MDKKLDRVPADIRWTAQAHDDNYWIPVGQMPDFSQAEFEKRLACSLTKQEAQIKQDALPSPSH